MVAVEIVAVVEVAATAFASVAVVGAIVIVAGSAAIRVAGSTSGITGISSTHGDTKPNL